VNGDESEMNKFRHLQRLLKLAALWIALSRTNLSWISPVTSHLNFAACFARNSKANMPQTKLSLIPKDEGRRKVFAWVCVCASYNGISCHGKGNNKQERKKLKQFSSLDNEQQKFHPNT